MANEKKSKIRTAILRSNSILDDGEIVLDVTPNRAMRLYIGQANVRVKDLRYGVFSNSPLLGAGGEVAIGDIDGLQEALDALEEDKANNTITDFILVYGAGTPAANGVYPYVGMSSSKPSYQKGTGTGSHLITWGALANKWSNSRVELAPVYYYESADNTATPELATFTVLDGAGPVPTMVRFTGTLEQSVQQQAELTGEVAEALLASTPPVVAQRTGSVIAFNAAAIYNTSAAPSSGAITYDLSGATVGVEVIAYFNHASQPSFPVGTIVLGVWDNSDPNEVRFVYGIGGTVTATIKSNAQGSYTNPRSNFFPTTDQTTTGITLVGITGISKTLKANKRYVFTGKLRVEGTASGGVKVGSIFSAASPAVTQYVQLIGRSLATTSTGVLSDQIGLSAGYNAVSSVAMSPSTSTFGYIFFDGTLIVGGADVDWQLGFASAVAGQTAKIYNDASHIELVEL